MKKKQAPSRPYRTSEYLKTSRDIYHYLDAALAEGDEKLLLLALRDVAQAKGMARVARKSGITREALYRMLSARGNPELTSLEKILKVFGLRLAVAPLKAAA